MADNQTGTTATGGGGLSIPDELKGKYPTLIALIVGSESMNTEERQYWINILPIMTPEQVQNLTDILENEKRQLEEIDKKYSSELSAVDQQKIIQKTQQERSDRRQQRETLEKKATVGEAATEEELLRKIGEL